MRRQDLTSEWMDDAACVGTDPEAFFPKKGGSAREAKRVCQRCEVKAECLECGLEMRHGVWGGTSESERAKLRRIGVRAVVPKSASAV